MGINSFTLGDCESAEAGVVPVDRYLSWFQSKGATFNSSTTNEPSGEPSSEPSAEPSSEPSTEPSTEPSGEPSSEGDGWEAPLGAGDYDRTTDETKPMNCSTGTFTTMGLWLGLPLIGLLRRRQ